MFSQIKKLGVRAQFQLGDQLVSDALEMKPQLCCQLDGNGQASLGTETHQVVEGKLVDLVARNLRDTEWGN